MAARTILHILRKEFLQIKRDKKIIQIVLVGPIIQLFLFGFAINLDVNDVRMVVCDLDHSTESQFFVESFTHSGYFVDAGHVERMNDVDKPLDRGDASLALIIPKGFSDKILKGEPTQVQAIVDGAESNAASVGLNYATMVIARYSQNVLLESFEKKGMGALRPVTVTPEVRVWYNPDLKSRRYLVPGILGMLLMTATTMLTALAIVKEKESGTMEQLIVTPIKPYQLIIGKLTPFLVIGVIDIVLALLGVTLIFGIAVRGSIVTLFALSMLFVMTTLGIGLFVSTISRTQQQAMMTAMFFVMMPMNFLSGFIFPIENMPKLIQGVSYFLPLRYYFEIIRGLFLRGVGMNVLWPQAAALAVFALGILTLSSLRFRKKLA